MPQPFFKGRRPHGGFTYDEFMELLQERLVDLQEGRLQPQEKRTAENLKLNLQRSRRIYKQFKPDTELETAVKSIAEKQLWMVLTEDWCGDSAQNLPVVARLAELNPQIDLRILERDENPDIMDLYLSENGTRSIPRIVAFNEDGDELFLWGPRPDEARIDFEHRKAEGMEKEENIKLLHTWYAKDRGKALAREMLATLKPAGSLAT